MSETAQDLADKVTDLLKEARLQKGLSHEKVAELAGIHRSTVSRVEAKKIQGTLYVYLSIAEAIGVPLGELITRAQSQK